MIKVEITKEELENYLFNLETIDRGTYGVIKKLNDDTCIKIYYKDIINTYANKNINLLDNEISLNLSVEKQVLKSSKNSREIYDNDRQKLAILTKLGYINKVLYYRGYKIGIEMNYYKNYLKLSKSLNLLKKDDVKDIIQKISDKLNELYSYNIYPNDLSIDNILINPETHDIILIDLDDLWTRYDTNKYFAERPQVKESLLDTCNSRLIKIKNYLEEK